MSLEILLNLVAAVLLIAVLLAHSLIVEPALKRHGIEPSGYASPHDWNRYRHDCNGSAVIYVFLWFGFVIVVAAVLFQYVRFFFFPRIKP